MAAVALSWIYVLFTTFCLGFGVSLLTERAFQCPLRRGDTLLCAGLIGATVYAQFFSLFAGVGLWANLILLGVCLGILLAGRRRLPVLLRSLWQGSSRGRRAAVLLLFVFWAYCASRGYLAYDSDLYHGQSIRWIEEYGVVKGLGNLHERFAYNSSVFALSALYSMKFLTGHSLHAVNGYFAFLLSLTALDLARCVRRRKLIWPDYARAAAVYYLTLIVNEVVAPASDYGVMCMIFWIVIKWLDALEEKRDPIAPYGLLCVAGVYALTLKLTAGLILLLLLKPAWRLLREKRFGQIGMYLGLGLFTALPWLIRTVLISGWLFYPLPGLDLFHFDWKMRAENIAVDAAQIKVWGRGLYDVALVNVPFAQWFPGWFASTLSAMEKLLILADLGSLALLAGAAVWTLIRRKRGRGDRLLVLAALACSYVFWQTSAPLTRYGYAYVLLLPALMGGWILLGLGRDGIARLFLALYGAYKLYVTAAYVWSAAPADAWLWQQDYGTYEVTAYQVEGETFYVPVYGDRTGYDPFPAAPTQGGFELRGEDLSEGFRPAS